jgi:hypothetical protein
MMRKQLDAVTNLVDNLHTGVPNINTGGGNPVPKKGTTVPNSSTPQSSGKEVSLSAAMALPINKGKSEADVRADIIAHGHKVSK